jgi:arsenate reductase
MMMKIYHNPRCRKSREVLSILKDHGINPEIIEYLKTPPTVGELKNMLDKMNMKPGQILRTGEKVFKENFKGKDLTEEEWLKVLVENPILIERPIVVYGEKVVLGRPPEKVKEILQVVK